MVTKQQALTNSQFHANGCLRRIGLRGGIREYVEVWLRSGRPQTWVTRPDEFRVPIKFGLRLSDSLTHNNAHAFHLPEDCPLRDPNFSTHDDRVPGTYGRPPIVIEAEVDLSVEDEGKYIAEPREAPYGSR